MKITFINGSRAGDELEYSLSEITIGREDGNILRIPVPGVSRYHAKMWRNDSGQWLVSDQGSTNGVKVNAKRISGTVELNEGDEVEVGKQIFRLSELNADMPQVIFNPLPGAAIQPPEVPESDMPGFAPGTAREVTPAAEEERTENNVLPMEALFESLKGQADNIFGGKKAEKKTEQKPSEPTSPGKNRRVLLWSVVAALLLLIVVITIVKGLPAKDDTKASQKQDYLVIEYVKEEISNDNIFRFAMLLEGDQVIFTIDDIKSKRHFSRKAQVEKDSLDILLEQIKRSAIWNMRQPEEARSSSVKLKRKLQLCLPPKIVKFSVEGPYPPAAFEEIENAISVLVEGYDLQMIALTSEELTRQAKVCFEKAEDLFNNREGRTENLRNAIVRYQQTVNYLEQFSPAPPMWDAARKRLAEAHKIRQRKLDDLNYEWIRASQIRDLEGLRHVLLQIIELTEPGSKEHKLARQRLLKLDVYLRKRNQ